MFLISSIINNQRKGYVLCTQVLKKLRLKSTIRPTNSSLINNTNEKNLCRNYRYYLYQFSCIRKYILSTNLICGLEFRYPSIISSTITEQINPKHHIINYYRLYHNQTYVSKPLSQTIKFIIIVIVFFPLINITTKYDHTK